MAESDGTLDRPTIAIDFDRNSMLYLIRSASINSYPNKNGLAIGSMQPPSSLAKDVTTICFAMKAKACQKNKRG
jgi:hypothetical protein